MRSPLLPRRRDDDDGDDGDGDDGDGADARPIARAHQADRMQRPAIARANGDKARALSQLIIGGSLNLLMQPVTRPSRSTMTTSARAPTSAIYWHASILIDRPLLFGAAAALDGRARAVATATRTGRTVTSVIVVVIVDDSEDVHNTQHIDHHLISDL